MSVEHHNLSGIPKQVNTFLTQWGCLQWSGCPRPPPLTLLAEEKKPHGFIRAPSQNPHQSSLPADDEVQKFSLCNAEFMRILFISRVIFAPEGLTYPGDVE
jgi:hypothetical protein